MSAAPRNKRRSKRKYLTIVSHYESCLERHGDTHLGVDWPNQEGARTRYRVMLELIQPTPGGTIRLLDFGCGASHLYEYILEQGLQQIEYSGLELSEKFIALSRQKFPTVQYYCLDILGDAGRLPEFDYVVMNGVFTEKRTLSVEEMFSYFTAVLTRVYSKARIGVGFNVMSKQVDWEREDLFHLPFDRLASFLAQNLSRHFVIRHDYGLYEYTVYVYKEPLGAVHQASLPRGLGGT